MIQIEHYITSDGRDPFASWVDSLDKTTMAKIMQRIDRVACGNFGDAKYLRDGVSELRVDYGPGYRLYYTKEGDKIIVLLCGGNKGTQDRDIDRAVSNLRDYVSRK